MPLLTNTTSPSQHPLLVPLLKPVVEQALDIEEGKAIVEHLGQAQYAVSALTHLAMQLAFSRLLSPSLTFSHLLSPSLR